MSGIGKEEVLYPGEQSPAKNTPAVKKDKVGSIREWRNVRFSCCILDP